MKTALEQLSTYKSVHLNKQNIKTHFFGIPMIIWSIAVLLGLLRFELSGVVVSLTTIVGVVVALYYVMLSRPLALFALIIFGPLIYSANVYANAEESWMVAIAVFVIGWVFQFIGHAYEKAKPAFVDDLNQLFIGPFFLISEIYFALGLDKQFEQEITALAVSKREAFEQNKSN